LGDGVAGLSSSRRGVVLEGLRRLFCRFPSR
jgi:hypothetical protein